MSQDESLKKLADAYKKMEEATSYTAAKDQKGGIKPVPGYAKTEPKPVDRKEGAQGTKEIGKAEHGSKESANPDVKPVARGEGSKEAQPEAKKADFGSDKAPEGTTVKPVDRKEGSQAAVKEYTPKDFRDRVKAALGLPLNSPLNKGNDGLNKGK
jgi:hypothetical protein